MTPDTLKLKIDQALTRSKELEEQARKLWRRADLCRARARKLGAKLSEVQTMELFK